MTRRKIGLRFLRATQAVPLICVALAGCVAASAAKPAGVSSDQVKQVIDTQFVPLLRSYDGGLSVTSAVCPKKMDFSGGRTDYCTIKVDRVPLRVGMLFDPSSNTLSFAASSFFEFDKVERIAATHLLNDYGIKAIVACGAPRFRLLPVGTIFTCSVSGSAKVSTVRIRADANGRLFIYNPSGTSSPAWIAAAVSEHEAGKRTVLDGPTVANWIQNLLGEAKLATGSPASAVPVRCPGFVDITGAKHTACIVVIQGHDVRREVFFDPIKHDIETRTLDVPVDLAAVQRTTQDDLNDRLRKAGLPADAAVHCGAGILVITPPGNFTCAATGNGSRYTVEVKIEDTNGTAHWRFVPEGATPTASSTASPARGYAPNLRTAKLQRKIVE